MTPCGFLFPAYYTVFPEKCKLILRAGVHPCKRRAPILRAARRALRPHAALFHDAPRSGISRRMLCLDPQKARFPEQIPDRRRERFRHHAALPERARQAVAHLRAPRTPVRRYDGQIADHRARLPPYDCPMVHVGRFCLFLPRRQQLPRERYVLVRRPRQKMRDGGIAHPIAERLLRVGHAEGTQNKPLRSENFTAPLLFHTICSFPPRRSPISEHQKSPPFGGLSFQK